MPSGDDEFNPQVLLATSGAANAGIDNPQVYGVFRAETPLSIEDFLQEKGRAGRLDGAVPTSDFYVACVSLKSTLLLLKRIYRSTTQKGNYQKRLFADLDNVLQAVIILERFTLIFGLITMD